MNTIYWITRFDNILTASWLLFTLFAILTFVGFMLYVCNLESSLVYDDKIYNNLGKSLMKIAAPFSIIFLTLGILTPTTNQAIAIYGGGKILEYVESNEKLQSMPDKVIDLTNKYIDTLNKELDNAEINKEN